MSSPSQEFKKTKNAMLERKQEDLELLWLDFHLILEKQ